METNFLAKNEFVVEDPTVRIRHQCPRSLVVLLVVINILTIVFGCTLIVKMTTLLNIPNEMDKMRAQLDEYRNQCSQIPKKDEHVLDNMMERVQAIEAANNNTKEKFASLTKRKKKLTALPNTEDEMGKIHGDFDQDENPFSQLAKNVTGMDEQILDLVERVQAIEAAFNATTEEKLTVDPNVESEMENMRGRLDEGENLISQLAENVTGADQQVMDMMKRTRAIEAAINVLEQKMTALLSVQDEMGKIQGRLDQDENQVLQLAKNFSGTDKQVLNMIQRTQTIEAANVEFKKRVSESVERTKIMGRVVWKFDKFYESTIAKLGSQGSKVYYGPTFYTSQFGYKMQLTCTLRAPKSMDANIMITRGEYDNLLEWPFSGKVTFIIFDQSQQQKNVNNSFVAVSEKSGACWSTWQRPLGNTGQTSPCVVQMLNNNHVESGNYIKNNTLFLGVEVESYNNSLIRIV